MKRNSLQTVYKVLLVSCIITTVSCKKMFDVAPQDQVDITNHYRNVYDANAAVIGIYGKFLGIADRYIVLNELRADLMSPTANADQYLRQLSEHTVTTDNPWANPRPFYEIILNCNDAMKNFDMMLKDSKMSAVDYQQRYSDIGAIRSWVYLQLGIHFGSVPYVTDALDNIDAIKDEGKYPKISFDQLLDKLIAFMGDKSRYMDNYPTTSSVTGATNTSLNTTVDSYSTGLFFINKYCLLGDLYLWKGDYTNASVNYHYVSDYGFRTIANAGAAAKYEEYKPSYSEFNVSYANYQDERSLNYSSTVGWQSMFSTQQPTSATNTEWIWSLPFDKNFLPVNPLVDLFSNQGGHYLVTASQLAMDNWNAQLQGNGFPYDVRGRLTVKTINGQPVIVKHLYTYLDNTTFLPTNILQKQGRWMLYRAGTLNLHFAEAACNDNQVKVAYALVNVGIRNVFSPYFPASIPDSFDPTNSEQTFLPAPYDMDARSGGTQDYHTPWYKQAGTRSRANLVMLPQTLITNNDKIGMENAIIDEDGLELAYEGNRWGDLLRVARRRNDPAFLAEKVYQKLLRDGNPAAATVRAKLSNPSGWYLPFKL